MIKHVDLVLNLNQMHIASSKKLNFHYRYDSICNWFRNSRFHYLSCISVWCDNIAANFWFSWTNWCDEPIRKIGNTIRERNLLWLKVFNYPAPIFVPASGCDVPITFYALLLTGQAWSILSNLDAIRGKDPDDLSSRDIPFGDPFSVDITKLTVGYLDDADMEVRFHKHLAKAWVCYATATDAQ